MGWDGGGSGSRFGGEARSKKKKGRFSRAPWRSTVSVLFFAQGPGSAGPLPDSWQCDASLML